MKRPQVTILREWDQTIPDTNSRWLPSAVLEFGRGPWYAFGWGAGDRFVWIYLVWIAVEVYWGDSP